MGYIAPNTTIQLFKGIKLYPGEENTAWFDTAALQDTYFTQRIYASIPNNTYQRINNNTLKIKLDDSVSGADRAIKNLYDVNYMRFKNINYENKWIYAFVTKVEYINNVTVQIEYEIDSVQTWLKDYAFEYSFIDRQHARTDGYFENLTPENLDLGDDYVEEAEYGFDLQGINGVPSLTEGLRICILASKTSTGNAAPTPQLISNTYMPLIMYGVTLNTANTLINNFNDTGYPNSSPDDIVAVYMYPACFGSFDTTQNVPPSELNHTFKVTPNLTTINGYTPRNYKLFNSPFKILTVTNNNGRINRYKWENWSVNTTWDRTQIYDVADALGKFEIQGTVLPPVSAQCYPIDYKGISDAWDEGVTIDNFPQCAWIGDTFKAWFAQNKASIATSLITSVAGAVVGANLAESAPAIGYSKGTQAMAQQWHDHNATSATARGALNVETNIIGVLAKARELMDAPPNVSGQALTETLSAKMLKYKFTARCLTIKREVAQRLDAFFDMYGYAVRKIAKPDPTARENWSYIKTIGCQIDGNIPAEMANDICMRFDSGIRFWKNPDRIGDYSLSNDPMGYEP